MRPIVQVRGVSKRYRVGGSGTGVTLRSAISKAVRSRWLPNARPSNKDQIIWALHDVSFEVWPGEVLGIIGRNGSGKSTLLKILSSITRPTAGEVDIYGRVGSLLEIGTGFHPDLTGRENIYLNGAIIGMTRGEIKRKFEEIVAFAELEQSLDTPIKFYSSGMYLRLAFAVSAHFEPEILILDEVLAVGDEGFRKKCFNKMKDVSRSGKTILFVGHDLMAVQELCGRALLLERGCLRLEGPAENVVAGYLSTFGLA